MDRQKQFNDLAKYKCMEKNEQVLSCDEIIKLSPDQLKYMCPTPDQLTKPGFYDFQVLTGKEQALCFVIAGEQIQLNDNIKYNKSGKRLEFKLNLESNAAAQYALTSLANILETFINVNYQKTCQVKSGLYRGSIDLPWAQTYGKYDEIEVHSKLGGKVFACHPEVNLKELEKLLLGQSAQLRVVVKSWLMVDEETHVKAGFKLHVQKVTLE